MTTTVLVLGLALVAGDGQSKPRKPSAIAPSLPALTKEEEAKLDEIIDRLIQADTGRLRGAAGRKAVEEFEALKSEAIPALIRGLNKAARSNYTCPVLMIRKKLTKLLMASTDQVLLEFARSHGITQIFVGHTQRSGLARLKASPLDKLIWQGHGMDVHVFPQ